MVRSEWGLESEPQGPHVSTHIPSDWMTALTMMEWLRFLTNLAEYQNGRAIHLILEGYAAHRCEKVRRLAEGLDIHVHYIRPGLTDLLQPLDHSLFDGLRTECRAIDRMNMSQREDTRMTKADFAACLVLAWGLVSDNPPPLGVLRSRHAGPVGATAGGRS